MRQFLVRCALALLLPYQLLLQPRHQQLGVFHLLCQVLVHRCHIVQSLNLLLYDNRIFPALKVAAPHVLANAALVVDFAKRCAIIRIKCFLGSLLAKCCQFCIVNAFRGRIVVVKVHLRRGLLALA